MWNGLDHLTEALFAGSQCCLTLTVLDHFALELMIGSPERDKMPAAPNGHNDHQRSYDKSTHECEGQKRRSAMQR